ncbi:MAG: DUF3168 domain-containing protein [Tabrizicola sp.]
MSAELALQKAMRGRLISVPAITAIVPATRIVDRHSRPYGPPLILLGSDLTTRDPQMPLARDRVNVTHDLHIFLNELSFEGSKRLAGLIRMALEAAALPATDEPWRVVDCWAPRTRFLRDPDGETSHAVVTVEALLEAVG